MKGACVAPSKKMSMLFTRLGIGDGIGDSDGSIFWAKMLESLWLLGFATGLARDCCQGKFLFPLPGNQSSAARRSD